MSVERCWKQSTWWPLRFENGQMAMPWWHAEDIRDSISHLKRSLDACEKGENMEQKRPVPRRKTNMCQLRSRSCQRSWFCIKHSFSQTLIRSDLNVPEMGLYIYIVCRILIKISFANQILWEFLTLKSTRYTFLQNVQVSIFIQKRIGNTSPHHLDTPFFLFALIVLSGI